MKEKILIVDDDNDIREMLSIYFSKEEYETKFNKLLKCCLTSEKILFNVTY